MGKLLFFLEKDTLDQSQKHSSFLPVLSHDGHLMQMAEAALYGGHEVFLASIDNFGSSAPVRQLLELSTFMCSSAPSQPASAMHFDLVFTAYPDIYHARHFPGAKTVGYFPALYYVEMPDHFLNGRMFYLLRALQMNIDFVVFQNDRQADFMDIIARSMAGLDIRPYTYLMPYGVPNSSRLNNEKVRQAKRASFGIADDDIVLLHGGGAWRWTDFESFLTQYIQLEKDRPNSRLKLIIPGLSQKANLDHNSYIGRIHELLMQHSHMLYPNPNWSIVYDTDWEEASRKMPDYSAVADIGISTSPVSLEYHLSHRVRVIDYIANGLGLLLSYGDSFSTMPELRPISFVANGAKANGYRATLEEILDGSFTSHRALIEAGTKARMHFRNGNKKLSIIETMIAVEPQKTIVDCPINHVFHQEKVTALKSAFTQFFATAMPQ